MDSPFQEIVEVKNCRKYLKRCYLLYLPIDESLLQDFSAFGFLEVVRFSQYSPLAKDIFKVEIEESLQITGAIHDRQLFITISKQCLELLITIEQSIRKWFSVNSATVSVPTFSEINPSL
jgi:hypothetical protein